MTNNEKGFWLTIEVGREEQIGKGDSMENQTILIKNHMIVNAMEIVVSSPEKSCLWKGLISDGVNRFREYCFDRSIARKASQ